LSSAGNAERRIIKAMVMTKNCTTLRAAAGRQRFFLKKEAKTLANWRAA
jgi:hypothetical protein